MWTIHRGGGHAGASDGFCATLDEAKAKFAETWRAWLALKLVVRLLERSRAATRYTNRPAPTSMPTPIGGSARHCSRAE
jgi:hypothetical protein